MEYWKSSTQLDSKSYVCGYCGEYISSNEGYYLTRQEIIGPSNEGFIYICHHCNKPTFFNRCGQTPGAIYGEHFAKEIFDDDLIYELYEESRKCMEINAFTSVGMCCRKLLMHIAVNCGAKVGLNFIEYVDFLDSNGYLPTNCKKWVDIIRSKGNEANHEITLLTEEDGKQLLNFVQMIISVIYKMPYEAKQYLNEEN